MANSSPKKPKIRKKPAKNGIKSEKLQVPGENISKEGEIREENAVNPAVKKRRYNVENLKPFKKDDERSRKCQSMGGTVKAMNARVLKANAAVVADSGKLPELLQIALDSAKSNPMYSQALIAVVKEAAKLVGATHDQSPEASQNVNLKADVKKAETVKFVIEDFTKPEQGEKDGGAAGE